MTFRINAPIDSNQHKGLLAVNSINGNPLALTGLSLTNAQPLHVAIVDGSGSQITTFGGGTQYTDGGVPPAHPVGGTIEWSDGSNWQTVSTAKPLPVSATFSPSGTQDINMKQFGGSNVTIGQQLAAASIPVILPSATITTLTPPSNTGYALDSSLTTIDTDLKSNITLHAGSNIIGNVRIDQTTPGTTNGVSIAQIGSGTIATAATGIMKVGLTDGTGNAITSTASALDVNVKSITGTNITVIGNKTNNNAAPGATNIGTLPAIANAAAPSWTEGDQVALSTDLAGNLRITGSISVGGTTDNSTYTAGSSSGTPAFGFYHSTIDTVTDDHAAAIGMTSKRAMFVNLQNATGAEVGTLLSPVFTGIAGTGSNAQIKDDTFYGDGVTSGILSTTNRLWNGTSYDRPYEIANAMNSTGVGITATGLMAQYDDIAPTLTTENNFGNLRTSVNRNLYTTIRDSLGSERGVFVNSDNQLSVSVDNLNNIAGQPIAVAAPGLIQVALTDTTGNEIASTDFALDVFNTFTSLSADLHAVGAQPYFNLALTNVATVVKPNNGNIYSMNITNTNSADAYIQFYDSRVPVTVGTALPTRSFVIPGGDGTHAGGFEEVYPVPLTFRYGIFIAATTTATGGTAPTTGLVVNLDYV